jgi:YYY domain-containing protein
MTFLAWYLLTTLLGLAAFPLTCRLFPALADRGYSLARAVGLLIWAYAFWILASLGVAQNDIGGILMSLLALAGLSAWALLDRGPSTVDNEETTAHHTPSTVPGLRSTVEWFKTNWRTVLTVEILFLAAFGFIAFVRANNPEIVATEKPMELAFINAILRSPTFPPNDPWLSGYSISYYHFGYIMAAMLAKLTATPGSVAFNLMLSLVFALAAIGAYGIVYNLLARTLDGRQETEGGPRSTVLGLPLLGPLFLLLVSNLEGFLEVLHTRGLFWPKNPGAFNFWTWLNIKDLNVEPTGTGWIPDRHWWWWRASRVVQDFTLTGNFNEVIDEFPFFSFLLGDLHPHVLALPFGMLAVGVALNLFFQREKPSIHILGLPLHLRRIDFAFAALVLGGLAFLNTWDILPYAALIVLAYTLARVHEQGWSWSRLEDLFGFGLPLGLLSILLYLPFYLGFSSQAGGPLPNLVNPTRGAHLWVMFGTLFVPLFAWLILQLRRQKPKIALALSLTSGLVLLLWLLSWLMTWIATYIRPDVAQGEMLAQGASSFSVFFVDASVRRLTDIGGLLTLIALLVPALALVFANNNPAQNDDEVSETVSRPRSSVFGLLLITIGVLLILAPEFVYLRDQFGTRMNTVFKFYYQAWILLSLAAAFGAAALLRSLRGLAGRVWRVAFSLLLIVGLTYPALSIPNKTENFNPFFGRTLDGAAHLDRENPDDAAAIRFLQDMPLGVVAEATAIDASYKLYGRISTHTGLPTVLGWPGHEGQWRGSYDIQGTRLTDIETLYTTSDWIEASQILARYNIRYVVVGSMEKSTYHVKEEKFQRFLKIIFQEGETAIYQVP